MKGLLLKDFYLLTKYCRAFLIIILVFLMFSFFGDNYVMMMFYPCIVTSMLPVSLQAYDEREKWDVYCGTLPYTRSQLVSAKYILSLICSSSVLILTALSQAAGLFLTQRFSVTFYLSSLAAVMIVTLISPALIMPFVFKYGSEKGRIAYYVGIGAICAVVITLSFIDLPTVSLNINGYFVAVCCIMAFAFYLLSWRLSIHFYTKQKR